MEARVARLRRRRTPVRRRPRVFFVCGSLNQTSQLHAIARELPDWDARFSPYYGDGAVKFFCGLGLAEFSIGGHKLRRQSVEYLRDHRLELDIDSRSGGYDLHVTCSDVVIPKNLKGRPIVAVQEDPRSGQRVVAARHESAAAGAALGRGYGGNRTQRGVREVLRRE